MNILIILIVISLLVASGFAVAFIWAVKSGQFDDAFTPSVRILWEDGSKSKSIKSQNKSELNNPKS
ncbi:hypothetical protein GCM10027429_24430 [Marivirga atlantica]|jgi:cbb3-type cytochrome oxidase maturation protein|uniref:Cbb3-type cytochrome oxidase assembly protein CcoS n=1 Tax=Marivirga atlantica TaxID=1548457 RepID=A0A937A915_9BACT|nr:cbb3-type cytochrome oxidase assembly protein CcoS [Marivirga atlantica]MBL0766042.1 cbb3-type cytochrome oxidase assembly protein CcoS [Marivirga atlantica]